MLDVHVKSVCLFLMGILAFGGYACDQGTVRDAAFYKPRENLRLCIFGPAGDPRTAGIQQQMSTWLAGPGRGLNIVLETADSDRPDMVWSEYGVPGPPPRLPATALIGSSAPAGKPFVVKAWEPAPAPDELQPFLDSPACARIRDALARRWAVVLHIPGNTTGVTEVLEDVRARWMAEQAPGIEVVTLDRGDPRERLLCAFAGVPKDGSDWAGIVFGKGKLLAPPVTGARIGEGSLNRLLATLAAQCTCLHESMRLGTDLPMVWDETIGPKALALSTAVENPKLAENVEASRGGLRIGWAALCGILLAGGVALAGYMFSDQRKGLP